MWDMPFSSCMALLALLLAAPAASAAPSATSGGADEQMNAPIDPGTMREAERRIQLQKGISHYMPPGSSTEKVPTKGPTMPEGLWREDVPVARGVPVMPEGDEHAPLEEHVRMEVCRLALLARARESREGLVPSCALPHECRCVERAGTTCRARC